MLNSMGEIKSALGATVIIPRWDVELEDHVWLDYAAADAAIPTFRHGRLVEVTLWSEFTDGTSVFWRHLEHHSSGTIEHALFQGTKTSLGQMRPLQDRPETAAYLPNAPALAWRRKAALKDAGRSDFNQLAPLFDNADEAWSSWMQDLKLGAGKLIVAEAYLRSNGPGAGASFDTFKEMFVGLQIPGDPNKGLTLEEVQFEIRVEQYEQTLRGIMREILKKAGYFPSSWGDPNEKGRQQTATEIQARTAQTERTRSKKNLYDRKVLSRMGSIALELDGILFLEKGGGQYDLNVVFPDISRTDPKVEAETIGLLKVAEAISTETAVRRANPNWDDSAVRDEVLRIQKKKDAKQPPDPTTFGRVDSAEEDSA